MRKNKEKFKIDWIYFSDKYSEIFCKQKKNYNNWFIKKLQKFLKKDNKMNKLSLKLAIRKVYCLNK